MGCNQNILPEVPSFKMDQCQASMNLVFHGYIQRIKHFLAWVGSWTAGHRLTIHAAHTENDHGNHYILKIFIDKYPYIVIYDFSFSKLSIHALLLRIRVFNGRDNSIKSVNSSSNEDISTWRLWSFLFSKKPHRAAYTRKLTLWFEFYFSPNFS